MITTEKTFRLCCIPGQSKDVVYKWGTVLTCKNIDIVGQGIYEHSPTIISIVDNVEACVFVV